MELIILNMIVFAKSIILFKCCPSPSKDQFPFQSLRTKYVVKRKIISKSDYNAKWQWECSDFTTLSASDLCFYQRFSLCHERYIWLWCAFDYGRKNCIIWRKCNKKDYPVNSAVKSGWCLFLCNDRVKINKNDYVCALLHDIGIMIIQKI